MRCLALLFTLAAFAAPAAAFEPTANYRKQVVQEFTVYLSPQVARNKPDADAALRQIDIELERVAKVVPERPLAVMRKVPVWVEWETPGVDRRVLARYFGGPKGVKEAGLNPDKAGSVEVVNARRFVANYQAGDQWVLLHELAHAYHARALTAKQDAAIQAAHKQAVERRLYDDVEHLNGARGRGYAIANHHEYFAILSEAYFGKTMHFPYDRPGLLRYDTTGYWLMQDLWGKPK